MHVAFDCREHDCACRPALVAARPLLRLHVGQEYRHRLLHDAGRLDHLRQEHLAGAEQVADDVHARHQRAFDDVKRAFGLKPRLLRVGLDVLGDPIDERMGDALVDRPFAPGEILRPCFFCACAAETFGQRQHAFRCVLTPVQHDVLAGLAQLRVDGLIDRELAGVDDAHVHPRLDGVIEEDGVHRFTHPLIAAKREREVRHPAGDMRVRQFGADAPRRLDKGDAIAVMLLDAGRNRENVGVEDNVFWRKISLLGQQLVSAAADRDLALEGVRLALFVEGHHHHRRAIGAHEPRLAKEFFLPFLHRNRVDDRFALDALEARLDDREF